MREGRHGDWLTGTLSVLCCRSLVDFLRPLVQVVGAIDQSANIQDSVASDADMTSRTTYVQIDLSSDTSSVLMIAPLPSA